MRKALILSCLGLSALLLAGCGQPVHNSQANSAVSQQRREAADRVANEQTECNECKQIESKRVHLGKPGLVGYVAFLADDGRPIAYYAVQGKCSSGSKRLTQGKLLERIPYVDFDGKPTTFNTDSYAYEVVDGPSEDGTYGASDEYIHCTTTAGAYVQWNGKYVYADQPFQLAVKPLVVAVTTDKNSEQAQ